MTVPGVGEGAGLLGVAGGPSAVRAALWLGVDDLVSKSNHQRRSGRRRYRVFELAVGSRVGLVRPDGWDPGDPGVPVDARPALVVHTVFRGRLDAGNASKSVVDAFQGRLCVTDAQVVWESTHRWSRTGGPDAVCGVALLDPGPEVGLVREVAGWLALRLEPVAERWFSDR